MRCLQRWCSEISYLQVYPRIFVILSSFVKFHSTLLELCKSGKKKKKEEKKCPPFLSTIWISNRQWKIGRRERGREKATTTTTDCDTSIIWSFARDTFKSRFPLRKTSRLNGATAFQSPQSSPTLFMAFHGNASSPPTNSAPTLSSTATMHSPLGYTPYILYYLIIHVYTRPNSVARRVSPKDRIG